MVAATAMLLAFAVPVVLLAAQGRHDVELAELLVDDVPVPSSLDENGWQAVREGEVDFEGLLPERNDRYRAWMTEEFDLELVRQTVTQFGTVVGSWWEYQDAVRIFERDPDVPYAPPQQEYESDHADAFTLQCAYAESAADRCITWRFLGRYGQYLVHVSFGSRSGRYWSQDEFLAIVGAIDTHVGELLGTGDT